jgi:hypothetical protein
LQGVRYNTEKLKTRVAMINMSLAMQRNRIMKMNLQTGIAAVSLGTLSAMAGLGGMNIPNGLESLEIENTTATTAAATAAGTDTVINKASSVVPSLTADMHAWYIDFVGSGSLFLTTSFSLAGLTLIMHLFITQRFFGANMDSHFKKQAKAIKDLREMLTHPESLDSAIRVVFYELDFRDSQVQKGLRKESKLSFDDFLTIFKTHNLSASHALLLYELLDVDKDGYLQKRDFDRRRKTTEATKRH